ncbi:aminotransferase class I/II-fold pyridoxal phosphate-dependent enzyme [Flavobacterium sp. UMI-01]|uniref:aminotransferase class I/II-fold pyridoxal phosphate-dependent enzyme n=1 Tax=Flavobacterium sp. UMI-01 TaxID=1441053 RepID=UPI001C7DB1F0|nr:aminotransferase class I/II-fold pyridoxal phosphate-dependent enzyme [Flavobacterium sp. UMI-01]GIZ10120.1 8-amino-7-oxononanoate synthase 1 [Flavobacterium sp. UMI-01]
MKVTACPDRKIVIDNQNYLYFGGTSYLGLPNHSKFKKLLIKNILKWGTTYGSSRNANIQLTAYDEGERFLAQFIKAEAAITVSSGMLAGKLILETVATTTDCFFHFPDTHNALKTSSSLPVCIDGKINPRLLDSTVEKITFLADAVPSTQIQPIDLSILNSISATKEITLVIDESHSLGLWGENGKGLFSTIDFPCIKRKIMFSSLGKSFGLTGGVIASDKDFIERIRNNDSFVSSAGMNPAFVQTLADAKTIYRKQHQKLQRKLAYVHLKLIHKNAINFNPTYPIIYPEVPDLATTLAKQNIIITHFKYPNHKGQLNRIVFTANHKKKDLDKIIAILNHL